METFRSIECVVRSAGIGGLAEVARCLGDTSWEAKSSAKQEVCFGVRLFSAAPRKFF